MADAAARTRPLSDPTDRAVQIRPNLSSRDGTLTKDGRIYNGYIEDGATKRVRRRPGLSVAVAALGVGQGMTVVGTGLVVAAGSTVYRYSKGYDDVSSAAPANTSYYVAANGLLYALNLSSRHVYRTSVPAMSWTDLGVTLPADSQFITFNTFLNSLCVVSTSNQKVYTSSDGVTWTNIYTAGSPFGSGSATTCTVKAGSLFVLGDLAPAETIWHSSTGASFTSITISTTPSSATMTKYTIIVAGSNFYAVGNNGTNSDAVWKSTDNGLNWTLVAATASIGNTGLGAGQGSSGLFKDGYMWVIAATKLWASTTGVSWAQVATVASGWTGIISLTNLEPYLVGGGNTSAGYFTYTQTLVQGTSPGSLLIPTTEQVDMIQNTGQTKVLIKGTQRAYVLDPATNTLTLVTDTDYPALTVRGVAYLNGTFYVMDPDGTIWGSDIDDPSSWSALNFVSAEMEPDGGVCIAKYLNYVLAFGQWTVQLFWDAANPTGSPLNAVQNGTLLVGCAHGNSVSQVESTLLWIAQRKGSGSTSQKGRFIAMMEGTNYVQVSTPDVDRILDADDLATVYSCSLAISGHLFYLLSLGTTGATLVYDLQAKAWYVWTRRTASSPKTITSLTQTNGLATATAASHGFSDGDFIVVSGATQSGYNLSIPINVIDANTFTYPVNSATVSPATGSPVATGSTESYFDMAASVNFGGTPVVLDAGTGAVWSVSPTVFTDNSQPIDFRIRTNNIDQGNNERKFCSSVAAIADLTSSSQTGLLRNSDDDFQTWSLFRRFDLSQVRANAQRWGNYRRRAWEWRFNGTATDHRLEALEAEIEQGNS